jgi:hypothetical protein
VTDTNVQHITVTALQNITQDQLKEAAAGNFLADHYNHLQLTITEQHI